MMLFRNASLVVAGLLVSIAVPQAGATEIVLRGADGKPTRITQLEVIAPDGTTKANPFGGEKPEVDLKNTPAGQEQIVVVSSNDKLGATSITGAPAAAQVDGRYLLSATEYGGALFPDDQVKAAEAAIKVCDRAAYDLAQGRLESYRLLNQADLWQAENRLTAASNALGIPPQRSVKAFENLVRSAERAAAGGFGDPARAKQLRDEFDKYVSLVQRYESAAFNLQKAAAARGRMPPYPEPCNREVGYLDNDGKSAFGVTFAIGLPQFDLPNYRAYSLEDMGNFLKRDVVNEDRRSSAFELQGSGYFYIPGTETAIRFGGSYTGFSSKTKLDTAIVPLMGQRFDIPTPDGGFFTTSQVDRFRIMQEFSQYQLNANLERSYRYNGVRLRPRLGVNFSYIDSQDASRFKIAGNFARFEEWRQLDTYGGGPVAGVDVEVPIERGVYAFAGIDGDLRWNFSSAKWKTQLDVTGNPSDKQSTDKSDEQLTWGLNGTLGFGYRGQSVDIRLYGSAGLSNHYPYLDVKSDEGDGDPEIEWDTTTQWKVGVQVKFGF